MRQIAIVNRSSMDDADVRVIAEALDRQVQKDFKPVWGIDAHISLVGKEVRPRPGKEWAVLTDTSDEAEALGYHDLTDEAKPMAKVAVSYVHASTALSHQLLEMLADPHIIWAVQAKGVLYGQDICDPCGSDQFAYSVDVNGNQVPVSDFVYPGFFNELSEDTKLDHYGHITEPFQILPGGCMATWSVSDGWQQLEASQSLPGSRPRVGSRRERRRTPREQWLRSDTGASLPQGEETISTSYTESEQ